MVRKGSEKFGEKSETSWFIGRTREIYCETRHKYSMYPDFKAYRNTTKVVCFLTVIVVQLPNV